MDNKHDGLWAGRPLGTAQPAGAQPALHPCPSSGDSRPAPQKEEEKVALDHRLAILVLALCLLTVVLGRHLSFSLSGPGYLPANPGEDWWAQQEEYSTDPPNIRRRPRGPG